MNTTSNKVKEICDSFLVLALGIKSKPCIWKACDKHVKACDEQVTSIWQACDKQVTNMDKHMTSMYKHVTSRYKHVTSR